MTALFTYGSLMSEDIMHQVAGTLFRFEQAVLNDYYRSKILSEEYPAVVPQGDSSVAGTVYFDVEKEALHRLDLFEGDMYARKAVEIVLADGQSCLAMVYVLRPEYHHLLTWEPWSYDDFLRNGKNRFIQKYFGFQEISKRF